MREILSLTTTSVAVSPLSMFPTGEHSVCIRHIVELKDDEKLELPDFLEGKAPIVVPKENFVRHWTDRQDQLAVVFQSLENEKLVHTKFFKHWGFCRFEQLAKLVRPVGDDNVETIKFPLLRGETEDFAKTHNGNNALTHEFLAINKLKEMPAWADIMMKSHSNEKYAVLVKGDKITRLRSGEESLGAKKIFSQFLQAINLEPKENNSIESIIEHVNSMEGELKLDIRVKCDTLSAVEKRNLGTKQSNRVDISRFWAFGESQPLAQESKPTSEDDDEEAY